MKKSTLLLSFLFVGLLAFTSCKGKAGNDQTSTSNPETSQQVDKKAGSGPVHLTKTEFLKKIADYEKNPKEWKYLGDKPAIIDFYADWCGPCKMVAPLLEQLSEEYAGQIYVYKVDVDKETDLARDFGIQSIPTIWFVPMKGDPQVVQGALPKEQLKEYVEKILLKK